MNQKEPISVMIAHATTKEKKTIKKALDGIDGALFEKLTKNKALIVIYGRKMQIALTSISNIDRIKSIAALAQKDARIYSAGLVIGEMHDGKFSIGLEGAFLISKITDAVSVIVNEKGVQLFSYAHDIFASSILRKGKNVRDGITVIVCNEHDEAIGLGKYMSASANKKSKNAIAVKNLRDRGWYLRRGM